MEALNLIMQLYGIIVRKTTYFSILFQKQVRGYKLSLKGVSEL